LKIKPATLLVGLIDLTVHMSLLATLFASYTRPDIFDHYYANSLSLVSSSSSSCLPTGSTSMSAHYKSLASVDMPAAISMPSMNQQRSSYNNNNLQVAADSIDSDDKSSLHSDSSFGANFYNTLAMSDPSADNTFHQMNMSSKTFS
jgi:hypothetical protein